MSEHTAEDDALVIHEPHCNTFCLPARGWHYLTDGVGLPHLHRTDMTSKCGACVTSPATTEGDR